MVVLFTILSGSLAVLAQYFVVLNTEFSPLGFSLLYIFPVGAALLGFIASSGIGVWAHLTGGGQKHAYKISIVCSIVFFIGTYYLQYRSAHVELVPGKEIEELQVKTYMGFELENGVDYTLNKEFRGMHLSEFIEKVSGNKHGFFRYLKIGIESNTYTFKGKRKSSFSVSNPIVNWLFFGIEFIGYLGGGLLVTYFLFENREIYQCEKCKVKRSVFSLFQIPESLKMNLINQLIYADKDPEKFSKLSLELPFNQKVELPLIETEATQCPKCKSGFIVLKEYRLNEKGNVKNEMCGLRELSPQMSRILIGSFKGTHTGYVSPKKENKAPMNSEYSPAKAPEPEIKRHIPPPPPPRPPLTRPPPMRSPENPSV